MSSTASAASEVAAAPALPPGPRLPSLAQLAWFVRDGLGMLETCAARYGDAFTVRLPWDTLVFTSKPDHVKQVFTGDPGVYHAGKGNEILRPLLGEFSVLILDGADHLRQRRLLLPPFHGERMLAYGELMRDVTLDVVERWPRGAPFPVHPAVQDVTLTVILRAVFGIDEGEARYEDLRRELRDMLDESSRTIVTFVPFLQVDLGPWSPYGRFRRRLVRIDRMLLEEIERRRRSADRSARSDVLSLLLDAVDEDGKPMTAEELRDELVTLLVAGHETSATSLAWTLYYVLRHPRVLAAVRAELREAFGDGPVTPGGIQGLRYLDAVVKEVARLRPILTFVARNLQSPVSLGEWRLPAGMTVAPCIYLVHRREDLYAAPEAFRPERFFDAKPSPYEYFPFGGGARRCLGMAFALYEMKVVLATVLSSVALELPEDSDVRAVRRAITIAPSDGVRVVARDLS